MRSSLTSSASDLLVSWYCRQRGAVRRCLVTSLSVHPLSLPRVVGQGSSLRSVLNTSAIHDTLLYLLSLSLCSPHHLQVHRTLESTVANYTRLPGQLLVTNQLPSVIPGSYGRQFNLSQHTNSFASLALSIPKDRQDTWDRCVRRGLSRYDYILSVLYNM